MKKLRSPTTIDNQPKMRRNIDNPKDGIGTKKETQIPKVFGFKYGE